VDRSTGQITPIITVLGSPMGLPFERVDTR
jgi:hypothetical protein